MGLLDGLARLVGAGERQPDRFPLGHGHPLEAEHRQLSAAMREHRGGQRLWETGLDRLEAGRPILEADREAQCRYVVACVERIVWRQHRRHAGITVTIAGDEWYAERVAHGALTALVRRKLPFTVAQLREVYEALAGVAQQVLGWLPIRALVAQAEPHLVNDVPPPELARPLAAIRDAILGGPYQTADYVRTAARIEQLLGGAAPRAVLDSGERWVDELMAEVNALPDAARQPWAALLAHLLGAESARPSAKWIKEAARLRAAVGDAGFDERARRWIEAARANAQQPVSSRNGDFLRGLVWCAADAWVEKPDARLEWVLADLAIAMARKIPNVGQRSTKVLNACISTLGRLPGSEALAQLTRLRARVKGAPVQKLIESTLGEAARAQGMTLTDLEELVAPTFGMDEVGVLREEIGGWTAEVRIVGTDEVETRWIGPSGKPQKSPPAELRREHADEVKELAATAKEMAKMLPAQRDRVERLLLDERVLPFPAWRERYLDHPLVGPLARRLVWHFEDGSRAALGAWDGERLVDVDDRALEWMGEGTRVRLWHPIGFSVDDVRAWRAWLERHEVVQPFKQAHREVYVITDAELATATYSNRFAAHIVRQHQLNALCRARGWRYALQGGFDNANSPTLHLPARGLAAELWVEPCLGDAPGQDTMTDAGIALYASTDQVRFLDAQGQTMELHDVPALVLSEVMRDVDLFVGVSSVGADPAWADRGGRPEWHDYWRGYAFGELGASAQTRREVLERLVPRLKIADRCRLDGKFLVVRGDVRTYKIHLGSGNILMEPNDQYLCIVPDRSAGARGEGAVRLPFEGDGTLSVILSKAFLLAADTRIADETILRQIRPR